MSPDHKKIVWLASYPKSGNTWFRVFIQNLLSDSEIPADINHLTDSHIATNRSLFDDYVGISSSDLTFDEVDILRPFAYEKYASEARSLVFIKAHDAWSINSRGQPLFPLHVTKKVIYVIRNPLDIVVSLANHNNITLEKAVAQINDPDQVYSANPIKLTSQLRHKISNWSNHVNSWIEDSDLSVHIIRYEDMHQKPFETFKRATEVLGLTTSNKQIKQAIQNSNFNSLRLQEDKSGFKEKPLKAHNFFHTGKINNWKENLSEKMVYDIILAHRKTMEKYDYQALE